MENGKII